MTYHPDLSPVDWLGIKWNNRFTAVGWLEPEYPYTRGIMPPEAWDKLVAVCRTKYLVYVMMGYHECSFCRKGVYYYDEDLGRNTGTLNYIVPGQGDMIYHFPDLILHYIRDHGYCPPDEFVQALINCPHPDSPEYLEWVRPYLGRQPR